MIVINYYLIMFQYRNIFHRNHLMRVVKYKYDFFIKIELNLQSVYKYNVMMSDIYTTSTLINNTMSNNTELSLDDINSRIKVEINHETLKELTDEKLMPIFKTCNSVKKSIHKLTCVLSNYIDEENIEKIIHDYSKELIPAGTKGVIRGNRFNKIVEQYINDLNLEKERFDVCFEKICEDHFTSEIPDWYILDKSTKKIIIGMNQLDLWGGGQQLNRGSKYIIKNKYNTENSKLLCVVCNEIEIKSKKNKVYNLFKIGFENDTLCYLNNLHNIIYLYFNLK